MSFSSLIVSLLALGGAARAAPSPAPGPRSIPGQWIVALKPETAPDLSLHARWATEIHARSGLGRRDAGGVEHTFDLGGFVGFSGTFDDEALAAIRANANVTAIEPDQEVHLATLTSQASPPWGLSAISHARPPASDADYIYDETAGADTYTYVLDSGVLLGHEDFEGRAVLGIDATGGAASDRTHGTHVAGTVGGRRYGVAKRTTIVDVQVTGSAEGQFSWILAGLDWTLRDVAARNRTGRAVINASLSTFSTSVANDAWKAVVDAGIPLVAAAGNSNQDAARYSPANLPEAITVAASNSRYQRWWASNWGPAVDLFAPGQDIASAWAPGPATEHSTSGTSMAAPHVAGVVAYLLGLEGPRTPAEIKARVLELAVPDLIQDTRGSPNLLLYNGNGA